MFNPFKKVKGFLIRKATEKALKPLEFGLSKLLSKEENMKGWRTIIVNAGLLALVAFLQYIAGLNLEDYGITGTVAVIVMAVVNFILRVITNTPIGKK